MFHVVLVEPEIPPNTGNIIRLCANTGAQLHLIEPLGFPLDDAKMRRAGLDYHDYATMKVHKHWDAFLADLQPDPARMFALTTHGSAPFAEASFRPGDVFVFGAETRGLAPALRANNVRGAFAVKEGAARGLHVGVVDDVMTSGHTLQAIALALKGAGARQVSNFVVARTPPA